MEALNKISLTIEKIIDYFLVFAFGGMTLVYFGSVFARFILNSGVPWAEEVTRYLNVALVMLGSATVARHNGHTNISVLELLAGSKAKFVQAFQQIITAVFFAISSYIGFGFASGAKHVSANLRIPMSLMYYMMAVAFALLAFQAVVWILNTLTEKEGD